LMAFGVAALTIGLLGAFQAQPIAGDLAASSEGARTDDLPEVMDAETDASASARADRTSDGADRDAEPSSSAFEDGFAGATTSGTETARPPVIAEVDGLALRLPTWSPEVV